ncbi:MAG TPA: sulfatase-like hydrolase/transferase [Candidatus Eisenbacteria bacterium]
MSSSSTISRPSREPQASAAPLHRRIPIASWLDPYARMLLVAALNTPFLLAVLAFHIEGVSWTSPAAVYAVLAFLGYYVSFLLAGITVLFFVTWYSRRLFIGAGTLLLALSLFYLFVNSIVHRIYHLHIDAFWIEYLVQNFSGIGFTPFMIGMAVAVLLGIVALQAWIHRRVRRARNPGWIVTGLLVTCLLSLAGSQAVHVVAHETNDTRITSITPQLPFYFPLRSHRNALKYGSLMSGIGEPSGPPATEGSRTLRYPRHEVSCVIPEGGRRPNILMIVLESWRGDMLNATVSPAMSAFAARSSNFLNHLSSGNATPTGIFSLLYGLHSTYWLSVKADNAAIDNPVLIDVLKANKYAFGIYADSHFSRHKIKDAMFRGIDVHESFSGSTADLKDADLTDRLLAFIGAEQREGTPFFGFAFYKATHFSYYYPADDAPFQPARDVNPAIALSSTDPTAFLNDYRNAIHYVDELVGRLLGRMDEMGVLENTIVIITSDHGEEFDDNHASYWGHCGNFTEFQTRVPMIIHVPWKEPRVVMARTSHVDIPPTILQEGFGLGTEAGDYSNGCNLFSPLENSRPMIVSSYVNHAIVVDDDVYVVNPTHLEKYKLSDIHAKAGSFTPATSKRAIEEMSRFYR